MLLSPADHRQPVNALGVSIRAKKAAVVAFALSLVFVVMAPSPPASATTPTATAAQGKTAADFARANMVGAKYPGHGCSGGPNVDCFVCSGGVWLAWNEAAPGMVFPGSAKSQYLGNGERINVGRGGTVQTSKLRPGDILFWSKDGKQETIYHNAIYLGNGQILQTVQSRGSWIGGVNDDKQWRMPEAIRPGPQVGVPVASDVTVATDDTVMAISGLVQDPDRPLENVDLRVVVYWRDAVGDEYEVAEYGGWWPTLVATQPTDVDPGGFLLEHTYDSTGVYIFVIEARDVESNQWFEIQEVEGRVYAEVVGEQSTSDSRVADKGAP